MNYNKAVIVGRLTRDPESKTLPSGQPVTNFSLATNRVWTDQGGNKQEAVEFHNVSAFGKLAEICSRYLSKGRLVLIEGRLRTSNWEDQNQVRHYRTEIVAENMQMGPKTDSSRSPASPAPSAPASEPKTPATDEDIPIIEAEEKVEVKDIPF